MADFLVRRDDPRDFRIDAGEPARTEVAEGTVQFTVERFGLTANNLTYAVFADRWRYWDFFPAPEGWGRIPVWGFGRVEASGVDGIEAGDRFYGYWPMSSRVTLHVDGDAAGFVESSAARRSLPAVYNRYLRAVPRTGFAPEHDDAAAVLRPLFLTGWLIADQFEDEGDYGVQQILIASASSKTAIGLGFALGQRAERPETIGLTSAANVDALAAQGIYDRVVSYDQIMTLNASTPAALVDMAGNGAVTRSVHSHFGNQLKASIIVGKSHWDAQADVEGLPGPERQGFFAPGRSQKRITDWGGAAFGQKIAEAWLAFMDVAPRLASVDKRSGGDAALAAYREMLSGQADPKQGIVVVP